MPFRLRSDGHHGPLHFRDVWRTPAANFARARYASPDWHKQSGSRREAFGSSSRTGVERNRKPLLSQIER